MLGLDFHSPHGAAWIFLGVAVAICLGPWVAERLKLPGLIGLLAGGFVISSNGLGIVPANDTIVSGLGQLGLLYLMFVAGAELDFDVLRRHRNTVAIFTLFTFGLPMLLSFSASTALGYSFAASLLLGSIWASHTLLTYPIVRKAGLASHPAVATAVGATVITDTLALVVLAGVAGSATGSQSGEGLILQVIIGLLLLGVWCGIALPLLGRVFYARISHEPALRYVFVLAALLSAGVLGEIAGIEAIVGAFFAGLGLNRMLPNEGPMFERIEFFGAALMIPLFLVSVGLIIDPAVMVEPETIGLAAVFTLTCLGGKSLAALACRPLFGYNWPQVGITFSLTASQAAATLAATFIGYEVGLIGTSVVNSVLIVIVVSVALASVSAEFFVRRIEPVVESGPRLGRSILLVLTGEGPIAPAVDFAGRLAHPDGGVVRPVVASFENSTGEHGPGSTAGLLQATETYIAASGLDCEVIQRHDRSLADVVRHSIADRNASSVVVAIERERVTDRATATAIKELIDTSPVPTFVVTADHSFGSLRLHHVDGTGEAAATGAIDGLIKHLNRSGVLVHNGGGSVFSRPLGLAGLLRRTTDGEMESGMLVARLPGQDGPLPAGTDVIVTPGLSAA